MHPTAWVVQRRFIGNEVRVVRIQEELETARRIQRAVLPAGSPSIEGLELESRYIPMELVAGDYFGREILPDGSVLLILADASGHGVPAAIIASMVHVAFIRELVVDSDPGSLLTAMNRVLHDQLEFQFVTAAVAWISPDRRTLRFAGAAPPPMLLWQGSRGAPMELVSGGRMIGYFPQELAAWRGSPERASGFEDDLTFMVVRNASGGSA